ncbi:MAG: hypothetical protein AB8H86_02910 [Polyangiales bacterium]
MRSLLYSALLTAGLLLSACSNRVHIGEDGFFAFALTEETPAAVVVEDAAMYIAEQRVMLPLEAPTGEEFGALSSGAEDLPWARRPWVARGDYEVEIDYVLVNIEESRSDVTIVINGINEFHEYFPEFIVDEEDIIPDFSQYERRVQLEPQERRFGTIREEHLDEVAVDLATVVNGASNANQVVHPDNHSASDARSMRFVPSIVPALTGVRVGLVVLGEADAPPPRVLVELTVRVRDERGILVEEVDAWEAPTPEAFFPSSLVVEEE